MLIHNMILALAMTVQPDEGSGPDIYSNITPECETRRVLPAPRGAHAVGVSNQFFVDRDREETATANPFDWRQVPLTIWYPAEFRQGAEPTPYMPELENMLAGFQTDMRAPARAVGESMNVFACVDGHGYRGLPAAEGLFPLIVFSPGGLMSRFWHSAQAQDLASHGYIVVMIGHHYSGTDVFPSGGLDFDPFRWRSSDEMTDAEAYALDDQMTQMLAEDAIFALDQMAKIASGDLVSELTNRVDLTRIALAGHSRGGSTVARGCRLDERFSACVVYDNIGLDREIEAGISTPQLTIHAPWEAERVQVLESFLGRNPTWTVRAEMPGAEHFTFSDLQIVSPERYEPSGDPVRLLRASLDLTVRFLDAVWMDAPAQLEQFADPDIQIHVNGPD